MSGRQGRGQGAFERHQALAHAQRHIAQGAGGQRVVGVQPGDELRGQIRGPGGAAVALLIRDADAANTMAQPSAQPTPMKTQEAT